MKEGKTKTCGNKNCEFHKIVRKVNNVKNKYDLSGEYGIGYTSDGAKFYFDLEDYDIIKNFCWYINNHGYIKNSENNMYLHRLVTKAKDGESVDHIHHDKLDNRKSQLRIVTNSQNQMNKDKPNNNSSGYKGISWHKNCKKWIAQIGLNGKLIYLGIFDDIEDAKQARRDAEIKYFGEYNYKMAT